MSNRRHVKIIRTEGVLEHYQNLHLDTSISIGVIRGLMQSNDGLSHTSNIVADRSVVYHDRSCATKLIRLSGGCPLSSVPHGTSLTSIKRLIK